MPMACKRKAQTEAVPNETAEPQTCYAFRFRAYWFVLAQTEGEDAAGQPLGYLIMRPRPHFKPRG
jgi:hypothetical protein